MARVVASIQAAPSGATPWRSRSRAREARTGPAMRADTLPSTAGTVSRGKANRVRRSEGSVTSERRRSSAWVTSAGRDDRDRAA